MYKGRDKKVGGVVRMNDVEKNTGEIVIFKTSENNVSIDVRFEGETVWLTQAQLVDLYNSSKANVSEHIKHIFEEEELDDNSVVREFRTTATDGKSYNTKYYNFTIHYITIFVLLLLILNLPDNLYLHTYQIPRPYHIQFHFL